MHPLPFYGKICTHGRADGKMERVVHLQTRIDVWVATGEAVAILAVACLAALGGSVWHCDEFKRCQEKGFCVNSSNLLPHDFGCSFSNYVSVEADRIYNNSDGALTSLTRGVCAPGERVHINSVSGQQECAPWRTWPSALNEEIQEAGATTPHERMCGSWLRAGEGMSRTQTEYWAFYDGEAERAAIERAERATYASARLSGTDLGKMYASCSHTTIAGNGAVRASARNAYHYLKQGMGVPETEEAVLKALGWLASHHCDGPVQLGVALSHNYYATAVPGLSFSTGDFSRALFAIDEDKSVQILAEEALAEVTKYAYDSSPTSLASFERIIEGAVGRTDHTRVEFGRLATPDLDSLLRLVNHSGTRLARGYLTGLAARCAFSIRATIDGSIGRVENGGPYEARPTASALGRLSTPPRANPMMETDEEAELNASVVTWTQLKPRPVGDPARDCADFVRFVMPDLVDEQHFQLTVSYRLYARLEQTVGWLRASVVETLLNVPEISAALSNPDRVALAVNKTVVRIPGAPRGSWAGISRTLPNGNSAAEDGVMLMALKHARATFLDRMSTLVFDDSSHCAGPPVFDALVQNAYIYPSAGCSFLLLGVLRRPMADERYDNSSLSSRAGWIVAHELSHNTLVVEWNSAAVASLLKRYPSHVYTEAMADVVAALSVIRAGLATASEFCNHVSQLWCARTPVGYMGSPSHSSHPPANSRGDWLCATLFDLGYSL